MADCAAMPSRSEGWGLVPREAACTGLPVIVQRCSGIDDGHTDAWATVIDGGRMQEIPSHFDHIAGEWMIANIDELATAMRWHYEHREHSAFLGRSAALWLRENQTWAHASKALIDLITEYA